MDKAQKQQGRIVLFKEEKDGTAYVRIGYSDHPFIVLLLSQDGQVKGVRAASQTHKGIHAAGRLSGTAGTRDRPTYDTGTVRAQ